MKRHLVKLFKDREIVGKVQKKLPYLFQMAELECSRAGKCGMEVGSLRERIIMALLIYKFGKENVETEIPITEAEIDATLFGEPVSIKTITGTSFGGVKLIWTVDAQKAQEFVKNYIPHYDILFAQINWNGWGGFYYIPVEVQKKAFKRMGRTGYLKLPKEGTNPRGVEMTKEAMSALVSDEDTECIEINWTKSDIKFDQYKKWVGYWEGKA